MKTKLNKEQRKQIARMHSAAVLMATEAMNAFQESNLSRPELMGIEREIKRIAKVLLMGSKPIFNADSIVRYVREHPIN